MALPTVVHPHLQSLHDGLRTEERAQAAALVELDELDPLEQIERGHAWPDLRIASSDRAGRTVRVLCVAPRTVELHEGIGLGEAVWITVAGQQRPAWVETLDDHSVEVRVEGEEPPDGMSVRIRRRHDPTTFARYREVLERADAHRSDLRRVLLGERVPPRIDAPVVLRGLNLAQQAAAGVAIRSPELALVHGPPGTGKTRLLGAVLARLVADGDRPWALADSNAAVDHLALTATALGLRVVRLGPVARFRPEVVALALETLIRQGPLGPALDTLERDLKRAWGTPAWRPLWVERDRLRDQAKAHAIGGSEVIATTFGTLARLAPTLPHPVTAVVDEATQAMEPAVWTVVPYVQRLVLVGDPKQLGPVIRTHGNPLQVSLLERLVALGLPMPMLTEQHRMPRSIRELVAEVYGPEYVDAATVGPGDDQTVVFVDTAGQGAEERDEASGSLFEPAEIEVVRREVSALRAQGFAVADIAVITPYSAQAARLSELPELEGIAVGTVNAWQGREARAVVVSFVRSNPDGELGFLSDDRRLTVALTRARERLVLIGDSGTLARHPRYSRLIDRLAAAGYLRSVWES